MSNSMFKNLIAYIFAVLSFGIVVYYMLGPSEGYLHSDCVDTLTWACATVDSGKFLSETFNYPYLLPFGATFVFYPFAKIFGFTMLAFRLSMLAFLIMFTLSVYFVCRAINLDRRWSLIAVGVQLMTLSSSVKLREIFWEHIIHYSLGVFLGFVLLIFALNFINESKNNSYVKSKKGKNLKKENVFFILLCLWTFFSTFDELTTLALSTIPVLGALFMVMLIDYKIPFFSKENKETGTAFFVILAFTVLGTIIFNIISKDISTSYGDAYSTIADRSEWMTNLMKFLDQWTALLGADYVVNDAITSGENIFAAIKMAASFVIILVPVYALFVYNKFNRYERIFLIYHWLLTGFIIYGYIFGKLSAANWRLSPIICSALVVNVMVWKMLWSCVETKRVAGIFASLIVLGCGITATNILNMPSDYGDDNDHHKAIEFLRKYDLDYGFATYWNANVLTLLSDGEIKVRDTGFDNGNITKGWLNCDNLWYEDQQGQDKYFVLLSESEFNQYAAENHPILENTMKVVHEGNWYALIKDRNIFSN